MSKGSKPRPYSVTQEVFAENFERIFGNHGVRQAASAVSKIADSGSLPDTPARYVDNATGAAVTEEWWPSDPIPEQL